MAVIHTDNQSVYRAPKKLMISTVLWNWWVQNGSLAEPGRAWAVFKIDANSREVTHRWWEALLLRERSHVYSVAVREFDEEAVSPGMKCEWLCQ